MFGCFEENIWWQFCTFRLDDSERASSFMALLRTAPSPPPPRGATQPINIDWLPLWRAPLNYTIPYNPPNCCKTSPCNWRKGPITKQLIWTSKKNKNTRCAQQQMHAAFVVLFHWAIPPGSKTNIEKFLTARLHIQKLPKIEGLGRVFPTKCWRNDTMNFRGGIEFSFEPHLNEQIWARHNKIGLGAPKLYCFTRDKGIDCRFLHSVLCSTLCRKAGLNIVVFLLCCCKFCEHQTCVTARANLLIFQLSHQIPTAPTQNVHSNEYHSAGEVINPLTFIWAWLLNRDP